MNHVTGVCSDTVHTQSKTVAIRLMMCNILGGRTDRQCGLKFFVMDDDTNLYKHTHKHTHAHHTLNYTQHITVFKVIYHCLVMSNIKITP